MTLTELSIKRPTIIVVIFAVLGVLGLFSFSQLQYELLPKMNWTVVTVSTVYPGASPREVETSVSKPIEDAVSGLEKISAVRTTSMEGFSLVMVEFNQSAKVDQAVQETQRKVNEIVSQLPTDIKQPTISKFAIDEIPVLRMGVTSAMSSREFYQFMKERIKPRLSQLQGVAQVTLIGGEEREIGVNIDAQKLRSYGLSIMQVMGAIKTGNLDFPTGTIKDQDGQYVVRVAGKIGDIDQLRSLVVGKTRMGGDITLADVSEVRDGAKERKQENRINGITSIGVFVQKQADANAVDMSKVVRAEIKKIESEFADKKIKFDVAADGSTFTLDAATAVEEDLGVAIILVAAVMLLFLHSFRNSIIVMIAIPSSLVSTFIAMYAFGFSLNLMTLLALSLVVGILVDDSIVVLENIHRHLEMGKDPKKAALDGRNEIGFTALSITLVDVVVFLPLSLVGGIIGNIMREFAVVVVVSTLLSLFVSFTVTPLLASRFTRHEILSKKSFMGRFGLWFESLFTSLANSYAGILKWALRSGWTRTVVVATTIVLFISSVSLLGLGFIGFEFITQADRGEFSVALELPAGASYETTNQVTQQVERKISHIPEVQKVLTNVGSSSEGLLTQASNNTSELTIVLVPKHDRVKSTDDVGTEIKKLIADIPGLKARINPIGIFGGANQTPIQIVVSGDNYDSVKVGAEMIASTLKKIPGTADVRLSSEDGKPELQIEIDREKAASLGLSIADVGSALRVALSGDDQSKFRQGNTDFDIRIQLDEFDRTKTEDVGNLTFMNRFGQQIELKQIADIHRTTGPTKLGRRDRLPSVTVFSQALGRPSGTIAQEFKAKMPKMPAGTLIAYDGDLKNQSEGFGSMGLAMIAGILFVYLIMVALYDSYVWPFVVLFSIPVAIVGALLALALTMKSLSIFAMLGFIMLIGLVGKNAILLVDFTNKLRADGMDRMTALIEAGRERLRPILMTTLTMIFGMLPIALASSAGAEWKSGLAWALVGGLTSSLLLTLVLVPVVYIIMDTIRNAFAKLFKRKPKSTEVIEEPATV